MHPTYIIFKLDRAYWVLRIVLSNMTKNLFLVLTPLIFINQKGRCFAINRLCMPLWLTSVPLNFVGKFEIIVTLDLDKYTSIFYLLENDKEKDKERESTEEEMSFVNGDAKLNGQASMKCSIDSEVKFDSSSVSIGKFSIYQYSIHIILFTLNYFHSHTQFKLRFINIIRCCFPKNKTQNI